jgi:AmpD protein
MNDYMIGIELVGDGNKGKFSTEQYLALADLCKNLTKKYSTISPRCIVGHDEISPGRKVDPGIHFNWRFFYKLLFKS